MEVRGVRQSDNDYAKNDAVNNENCEGFGAQVPDQPSYGDVAHDGGNDDAHGERRPHIVRDAFLVNLVSLDQGGAGDDGSSEQKAEADSGVAGEVTEKTCGNG